MNPARHDEGPARGRALQPERVAPGAWQGRRPRGVLGTRAAEDAGRGPETPLYIIPPMSGIPPAPTGSFSGISATIASVVRMFLAIEAAFWSAERVTIAGSITPAATRSSISPLAALRPWPSLALRTCSTTTEPSW